MSRKEIISTLRILSGRSVHGGGFSEHSGAPFRVDATAWAILALKDDGTHSNFVKSARSRLASEQCSDGRMSLAQDQPQAYWSTPLAILAWHGSNDYAENKSRGIQFLLTSEGTTFPKGKFQFIAHDSSLKGWPWIEDTFAWVEPTALSILSLSIAGYGTHKRVQEAIRLLMDRQLPSGGWNYGNTIVYGQELYPQPESTCMALTALAGQVEKKEVQRSLDYLKVQAVSCRTPLSLGWALFSLGAWSERPAEARSWIVECLSRQRKFGAYGTTLLSLLLLAYKAKGGFLETIS